MPFFGEQSDTLVLLNANVTTTGANSSNIDTQGYENATGTITVQNRASGTNDATVTVTHSLDGSTNFDAVPEDALFNIDTGEPDELGVFSTVTRSKTVGLDLQKCRRYVRVQIAGTSLGQNMVVAATLPRKYVSRL